MNALRLYLFAHYLGLGAILPLLALSFEARGFRPSEYAFCIVLIPISRLLAPPLWGALADRRLGALVLLRVNTALSALAMFIFHGTQSAVASVAAFAAWAFVSSSLVPLIEASTYRVLGARASGFGYVRVFGSLGFVLSAVAFGTFGVDAEVRSPFLVSAGASVLGTLATFSLRDAAAPTRAPLLPAVRALAHRLDVRLLWGGSIAYYVAHGVFDSYFGPYARTLPDVRTADVSSAWGVGVVSEIATILLMPRWLEGRARPLLLAGSATVAALRWALLARAESALHLFLLAPLHGVTFGVWYLAFVHENQARAHASIRATVQGVAQAAIAAGMLLATLSGGYLFERLGGRALFQLAALAALASALLYAAREWVLRRSASRLATPSPES